MNKEELKRKGEAAKTLLENPDFLLAMDTVKLQAFRDWSNSKPDETARRDENYYLLQAVTKLTENLEALAANARFEELKAEKAAAQERS